MSTGSPCRQHTRPPPPPKPLLPALRRSFHASAARRRDHHFDTLKFVQRLEEEGFTEEQSAAMMKVLNDVIEERFGLPILPPPLSPN